MTWSPAFSASRSTPCEFRAVPAAHSAAQRTTVRRGAAEGGYVEILEGLSVGDRVVADGLNRVQPNAAVCVGQGCAGGGGKGPGRARTP